MNGRFYMQVAKIRIVWEWTGGHSHADLREVPQGHARRPEVALLLQLVLDHGQGPRRRLDVDARCGPPIEPTRFRARSLLGSGSHGIVVRCRDTQNGDRNVAIKMMKSAVMRDRPAAPRPHRIIPHPRTLQ